MTKKYLILLANDYRVELNNAHCPTAHAAMVAIIKTTCDPNFDRDRFLGACGL